jgi:lipopolysaccharide transport system permease protein
MIWGLFNYIFSQASNSLLNNQDIIRKMSFPKIILPLSKIIVALVEFGVTIVLFFIALIFLYPFLKWQIIFSLFIVVNVILFSLGLSLILSAATIKNRDLNHVVPFLVNFGIWFTPVFYPVSLIPEKWSHLIYLNPMASFVQLFRCTVLPEKFQMEMLLGIPIGLVIFTIGFFYFKSIEDSIVDSI